MNNPSQHEPDDELLSAYLDDELSTEDRARVESRLAADPAARQTLEQLRSVSQSVRDLPFEGPGPDLRDSILRRVEASNPKTSRPEPSRRPAPESKTPSPQPPAPSPQFPSITIGRTRRGWVWASLAVAAAILIMVFQPGGEQNADLPNVALTNKENSVDADRKLTENRRQGLAINEPAAPAAAPPELTVPSTSASGQSAPMPQDVAADRAAGSRSEALDALTTNGQPGTDAFATQMPAEVSEQKSASSVPAPAAPQPSAGPADAAAQQVVVHVLTKRAAFENKAFDELLRTNGVNFEPVTREFDASGDLAAREPAAATSSRLKPQSANAPADEAQADADADVEMVLVEAPSSTIFSCMDALNKDANNYLGVAVDDASVTEEVAAVETPQAKKLATDMGKFNRGIVPQQQDKLNGDKLYYFQSGDGDDLSLSRGQRFSGGRGGYGGGQKEESSTLALEVESDRGHARRVQPQAQTLGGREKLERTSKEPIAGVAPAANAKLQRQTLGQLGSPAAANPERMQVLFVLRPSDDPAPSLKAKNRAE